MRQRLPYLLVLAAILLLTEKTGAQVCTSTAAPRGLLASSFLDTALNVPNGEDTEFFTRTSGTPNIFFLLDTSLQMRRLPPNGPAYYPGTRPPLEDVNCPSGGSCATTNKGFADDCANPTSDHCAIVGCGLDPESVTYAGSGTLIEFLASRTYTPPCGDAVHPSLKGQIYTPTLADGSVVDYANESSVCSHWGSSGLATGNDGYDPDWYCGSDGTKDNCSGQKANLFDRRMVFHDTLATGTPPAGLADGWTDTTVSGVAATSSLTAIENFCSSTYPSTARQGGQYKQDICKQCLRQKGFLLDGRVFHPSASGTDTVPSIWYTGNFLNMYPPKFVIARKVMKDVIATMSKVRSGLAHFSATGADATSNQWQSLSPTCDHPDSSFDSSRSTYINAIDSWAFNQAKPLSRALLDIGQYFHSPDLPWFNITSTSWNSGGNANQQAICYACQNTSIVVVTDGISRIQDPSVLPAGDVSATAVNSLYAGDATTGIVPDSTHAGIPTSLCPSCNDFSGLDDWKNTPTRVAWYLHNLDLRKNTETTLDCQGNGGKQVANVYTVGFASEGVPDAPKVLANMAKMGGGLAVSGDDASTLKQGILNILQDVNTRSTSFSVATVSTLQTTAGHSVIVPRFEPSQSAHWKGHLFRYELYSEFLNPCTETADGSGAGDLDCDGKCASVFLMDRDGDFIQEDTDGILRKNDPKTAVPCTQAPRCAALGRTCGVPGTSLAAYWWDSQVAMSQPANTWTARKVYTVVDSSGDGQITAADEVFQLQPTDAVAAKIIPYLPLGSASVCNDIANKLLAAGDSTSAAQVRASSTYCVKTMIRYVLGADVFNEQNVTVGTTWPAASISDSDQNNLPDRAYKLGDIFHSSPVVVEPPLPADGVLCPNGLHNQCISSLWQTPVPSDPPNTNAYDTYAKSTQYKNRRKIIVVGANDGLLHAFDGGTWQDGQRDPFTWEKTNHQLDTSKPPFNGYYDRGTGTELWAFLPPDMIAKIPLFLSATHQLFVDGSPMVRDVWVDGTHNAISPSTTDSPKDGKKQAYEFHTVALVAQRRGGTHYLALDVTDATKLSSETGFTAPKFLWIYPQPDAKENLSFAETYNDYLPVGPPIGPVRLESSTATTTMTVPAVTDPVPYEERWITFLSGGFDPQYLRGRGVHMVDVWTGSEIWDFAYPDDSSATTGDGLTAAQRAMRLQLKAPVPATVAMVMWGKSERRRQSFENDGYFDTATFGDAGGQLWVLRFAAPGHVDSTTGKVNNWNGARIFEMPGCANQPFFYITANVPVSGGIYRVLAGTGDRFNLLDKNGGDCGPDNIRACIQRGCTVTIGSTDGGSPAAEVNTFAVSGIGKLTRTLTASSCTPTYSSATGTLSTCDVKGSARIQISSCPSPVPSNGPTSTLKDYRMTCTDTSSGYACGYDQTPSQGAKLALSNTTNAITQPNWFFSLRVWNDTGDRMIFWDDAAAARFDSNRWQVSSASTHSTGIVVIDGAVDNPTALAAADDPGWAMYYDHGSGTPPTVTVADHSYPVSTLDERTSSTSGVYGGIFWNTTQPALSASTRVNSGGSCPNVALCTMENRRIAYHYGADPATGASVLRDSSGTVVRSFKNTTLVPTQGDQPTVFVNQKGQIQIGLTAVNPEKGASNIAQGQTLDPAPTYGFTEVSRDAHACRHADTPGAASCVP